MANKLELTWYGKDEPIRLEPRLLIENPALSNLEMDAVTGNMLIHGDNLLALKALERRSLRNGYTNLHFILLKVLKLKDLRKIKNRIKIIVVLANQKARFFYFRCVNLVNKFIWGVS